jgi:hypothetical protein
MTFLELCRKVRMDSGVSAQGPAAVTGQTGILAKIVEWVSYAERDVLALHKDWQFLRDMKTVTLPTSENVVSLASEGVADLDTCISVTLADGQKMRLLSYAQWLDGIHKYGNLDKSRTPAVAMINNGSLLFWPGLLQPVTVNIHYYRKPKLMVANSDPSDIPEDYRQVIIHKAMMYYADYEEDIYRYQRSEREFNNWLNRLAANHLPAMQFKAVPFV